MRKVHADCWAPYPWHARLEDRCRPRRLFAAFAAALALFFLLVHPADAQTKFMLQDFVLSPDGRTVATSVNGAIGLFEWQTGKLTRIPPPSGATGIGGPSFSTDGKKLIASISRPGPVAGDFAIIDLDTMQATLITAEPKGRNFVFQPGDRAILYQAGNAPSYLCLHDLETHTTRIVLRPEDGFYTISNPNFVSRDEILFAGMSPRSSAMVAAAKELTTNTVASAIPYRLRFGGLPEIVFAELVRRADALTGISGSGPTMFAASRNGERIVFLDRSLSEEERVAKDRRGYFRYDLFVIEGGAKSQVTKLEGYMSFVAISYDGSTAAFGTYAKPMSEFRYEPAQDRPFDLSIVDLRTGIVTPTDLVARVNADPRFSRSAPIPR
jgi:Tol biopolymer transport system component